MKTNFRNESGLTLVEVLAAVVLLGIAVVAFVQLSDYDLLAARKSKQSSQALQIADQALVTLRADIAEGTPYLHYPFAVRPFSCTKASPIAACQQLPPNFELKIEYSPYRGDSIISDPPAASPQRVSSSAIILYQEEPVRFTITVGWEGAK